MKGEKEGSRQEKSAVDTFMETGRKRGLRPGPLEAGGEFPGRIYYRSNLANSESLVNPAALFQHRERYIACVNGASPTASHCVSYSIFLTSVYKVSLRKCAFSTLSKERSRESTNPKAFRISAIQNMKVRYTL